MLENIDENLLAAIERYKQNKESPEDRVLISEALASEQIEITPDKDAKIIRQEGGTNFGESNVISVSGSVIGTQYVSGFTAKQVLDLIEERNKQSREDSKTYTINTPANRGCSPTIVIIASIGAILFLIGGYYMLPFNFKPVNVSINSTPTPEGYIDCTDPSITESLFPQLEQKGLDELFESSSIVPFVSSNPEFSCLGVNDEYHSPPLSVRFEYYQDFENWGIDIPEGLDASQFEDICFWVLSKKSNPPVILNLFDIENSESSVWIQFRVSNQWEKICTELEEFSAEGVDLQRIKRLSLLLPSGDGTANIWIDDFEFR